MQILRQNQITSFSKRLIKIEKIKSILKSKNRVLMMMLKSKIKKRI